MSQRSSVTLPPITNDFRSARKSVPISHTPKIASSGIVIEEDRVVPPEAPESKSLSLAVGDGEKVLPEIIAASGAVEEDEVL